MLKIKRILLILTVLTLFYTRFVNLGWGLPYPMHPDERNMADAVTRLNCNISSSNIQIKDCFNPHFFAYGQLPLYLSYIMIQDYHLVKGQLNSPISFIEAVMSLRFISALASVFTAFVLLKIIGLILKKKHTIFSLFIITFSPFFIQFSHFGTTESILMFFYSLIIYLSLKILQDKSQGLLSLAFFCGLALATKISSLFFLSIPIFSLLVSERLTLKSVYKIIKLSSLTLLISIIFSPQNYISFTDFLGAIRYESDVGLGVYKAFYTRQFDFTAPVFFQFFRIFPYTLGLLTLFLFVISFIILPWRREVNLLRLGFLVYFIPNAFLYAKWTRFMAPVFPLMLIFAILLLLKLKLANLIKISLLIIIILPGLAYLSIYQNPDIRFTASKWIFSNIPSNSNILSETANVVDIPVSSPDFSSETLNLMPNYNIASFNFYDLDEDYTLQTSLNDYLSRVGYIFVPSRRILLNHTCLNFDSGNEKLVNYYQNYVNKIVYTSNRCDYLKTRYPLLNNYYMELLSGSLGFKKVAEFSSYPKIQLFGKTLIEFPDEEAEETWTVFDHPVIRIFQKI